MNTLILIFGVFAGFLGSCFFLKIYPLDDAPTWFKVGLGTFGFVMGAAHYALLAAVIAMFVLA